MLSIKKELSMIVLLTIFLLFFGFGTAYSTDNNKRITLGTAGVQGSWYQVGTVYCNLLNTHLPNVQAKAIPTPGALANISSIQKGEMEMAWAHSFSSNFAYEGINIYEDKPKKDLRFLTTFQDMFLHIFTLDEDIKSINDLKGKRVAVGTKGAGAYIAATELLKGLNLYDKLEPVTVGLEAMIRMLKAGQIDAGMWGMSIGTPGINSLCETRHVHFIPVTSEEFKQAPVAIQEALTEKTMPANSYRKQDKAIKGVGYSGVIIAPSELSNELVYDMTRVLYENLDEIKEALPETVFHLDKSSALSGCTIPIHPGAEKYYEENNFPGLPQ